MEYYNEKLSKLTPYNPCVEEQCIIMDANESYLNLSQNTRSLIAEQIANANFNRYPDYSCKKLCEIYAKNNGVNFQNVVAGNGSDELISVIINAFTQKGDKVLTFDPDFSMYNFYCDIFECKKIVLEKNEELNILYEDIINAIKKEGPTVTIFSNPCNPTGQVLNVNEIEAILKSTDSIVIVDEAYMDFCVPSQSVISLINKYKNLIVLKTLSKAYGAAAIRLGFAVGTEHLISQVKLAKSPFNVSSLTQIAGEVILQNFDEVEQNVYNIIKNKNNLHSAVSNLLSQKSADFRIFDTKTNFVVISSVHAKSIFKKLMAKKIRVRLINNLLRITSSNEAQNKVLTNALSEVLEEY